MVLGIIIKPINAVLDIILAFIPKKLLVLIKKRTELVKKVIKLKKYKKPILFIHADMDNIIPINEAELMLRESGSKSKKLLVAKGANHNNIIMVLSDEYFKGISKFVSTI